MQQLQLFRRQVLQLQPLSSLTFPSADCLRSSAAQEWIYDRLFDDEKVDHLPDERYRLSILKPLLAHIEASITDPEEDVSSHFRSAPFSFSCHLPLFLVQLLILCPLSAGNFR